MEPWAGTFSLVDAVPRRLRVAVLGTGSRGAGLAKAFQSSADWELAALCDADPLRAGRLARSLGDVPCFAAIDELLDCVDVDAVAIATSHRALYGTVMTALRAGKHVLVEGLLADSLKRGREMAAEAESEGLVLMAKSAVTFDPAVQRMQKLLDSGTLGEILFIEARRTETGPVQTDRDVFWELSPATLAVLDHVLPGGLEPRTVSAFGGDPLGTGRDCVGHLYFRLSNDAPVHLHINRLSTMKSQRLVIAGTRLTLAWDALGVQERLRLLDPGSFNGQHRTAPYWAEPILLQQDAEEVPVSVLEAETRCLLATELAHCIRGQRKAYALDATGLRVLSVLEAATRSRGLDGQASPADAPTPDPAAQETAGSGHQSTLWST
ncbi:MAG: Gfo/Idh/MocA family oxidoreductase [Pseudarthrobacter sp.]|nr:Gfo/Idh/MocA family oxidoreductase [Pseudarthrobacter sp.]